MPDKAWAILTLCGALRTKREHADFIQRRLRLNEERSTAALAGVLRLLADDGLLISRERLEQFVRTADGPCPRSSVEFLCIPTRNRPPLLRRAVWSYLSNCRSFGRRIELVIADDSEDTGIIEQNLAVVRDAGRQFGGPVSYLGADARRSLCAALAAASGVDGETVRFALFRTEPDVVSTGCMRNAILLHTAGSLLITVDDDTVCSLGRIPESQSGICISSSPDPTEFWFFPDRGAMLANSEFIQRDFIAEHESLLGRSAAELIAESERPLCFDFSGGVPDSMSGGEVSTWRTTVTSMGLLGDSGMGGTSYYSMAGGRSRARLACAESDAAGAAAGREVWRAVRQRTLNTGAFCMSTNLGLDQRQLLPPFFPLFRNQDSLFALTLRACRVRALFGFIPMALAHWPDRARSSEAADSFEGIGAADIIAMVLSDFRWPETAEAADAMRALGVHLTDISTSGPLQFRHFVANVIRREMCTLLIMLDRQISEAEKESPVSAITLKQRADALRRGLVFAGSWRILEYLDRSLEDGYLKLQQLCAKFGLLLKAWPDLVEGSIRLRRSGAYPGVGY